jgi:hypothetical protein
LGDEERKTKEDKTKEEKLDDSYFSKLTFLGIY